MSHDIMIDLETLGTTADAVILSIGAVQFDLEAGTVSQFTHYSVLNIESQPNRDINRDTVAWWMKQSPEAAAVLTHQPKVDIKFALGELSRWMRSFSGTPIVWSNGADFDLPMLGHAYTNEGLKQPWAPYAGRCYRTYKNLPGARAVKVERQGQHHNALDDAIYQAQHLCAIHAALFGKVQGGAA